MLDIFCQELKLLSKKRSKRSGGASQEESDSGSVTSSGSDDEVSIFIYMYIFISRLELPGIENSTGGIGMVSVTHGHRATLKA